MQVQKCVSAPNSLQAEANTKKRHELKQNLSSTLKYRLQFEIENASKSDAALTGKMKDWKTITYQLEISKTIAACTGT